MSNLAFKDASPKEVAEQLAEAHDAAWIRSMVSLLDQRLQKSPLERIITLWSLTGTEAGQLFGVSRQAIGQWLEAGPPIDRAAGIAALADATDLLARRLKRERIPVVVRRPAASTGNRSLMDLAADGQYEQVLAAVQSMFDLRRIQP